MAAPTITARGVPGGKKLLQGYKSTIAFALNPTVDFFEKSVTPPGIDGGEPIDTTTMFNNLYRNQSPRVLVKSDNLTIKGAYDPACMPQFINMVNVQQSITINMPDTSTFSFFGYIQKFQPDALEDGKQPEATLTIVVTNYDPINHVEQGPVYTAGTETGTGE